MTGLFSGARGFMVFAGTMAVLAVINLSLGSSGGISIGGLSFRRPTAWLVTTAIFAGLLAFAGRLIRGRIDGVFIDERNRVSLSRVQFVMWTMLLFPALMTAGFSNVALGMGEPLMIRIPREVWALLGLGAFSFVVSPAVVDSRKSEPAPAAAVVQQMQTSVTAQDKLVAPPLAASNVPAKQTMADARWIDVIRGDTVTGYENLDVSKIQQLAITVVLVLIYAASLQGMMAAVDTSPKPIMAFPPIDEGFVALLGLSHASYLAYKKTAP